MIGHKDPLQMRNSSGGKDRDEGSLVHAKELGLTGVVQSEDICINIAKGAALITCSANDGLNPLLQMAAQIINQVLFQVTVEKALVSKL